MNLNLASLTHHPAEASPQRAPLGLILASLVYWGFANASVLAATIIALIFVGHLFIRWRWEFSDNRFTDIFHLCLLILFGAAVAIWSANNDAFLTFILLFKWLPLIFMPLFAAQVYSTSQTVSLKTFFQALQLKEREEIRSGRMPTPISRISLDYPYFVLVLAAASASNQQGLPYYLAASILVCWAIWQQRSHRMGDPRALALLGLVCILGFAGQKGLYQLQRVVENLNWFSLWGDETDLKMSQTNIGALHDVKQNGGILLRIRAVKGNPVPTLLQETTYTDWMAGRWTSDKAFRGTSRVNPATGSETIFNLVNSAPAPDQPAPPRDYSATVMGSAKPGRASLIPLPPGTRSIQGLASVGGIYKTASGAVRVEADRTAYTLKVNYNPRGPRFDAGADPLGKDLVLPAQPMPIANRDPDYKPDPPSPSAQLEENAIRKLADELKLAEVPPAERAARIRAYFQQNFQYSLSSRHGVYQNRRPHSPLVDFLEENKVGHCEFFATATVLLLRASGVPARYVVGYSVQEYSAWEKLYLVRSLHAHSWATAYYDGGWHEVDSTPSSWAAADIRNLSFIQPVKDFFNAMWSAFNQWRSNGGADLVRQYAPWVVLGTLLVIGARSIFGKGANRRRLEDVRELEINLLGKDSAFFPVMEEFSRVAAPRRRGETTLKWLKRIRPLLEEAPAPIPDSEHPATGPVITNYAEFAILLEELVEAHYRYRFDPLPLPPEESARLAALSQQCMELLNPKPVAAG